MGDGNDTARNIHTQLPVLIEGGSDRGQDTYDAGNPPFLTQVKFRGGDGVDFASYAGAGQGPGGRGVRISNDGVANDGRPGLDTDNIGRDVEVLTGSRFADEITGAGDRVVANTFVEGGQGDDVLRAGSSGRNVVFEMGPVADGADKILGGPTPTIIDYRDRTRAVTATLNFGGADDGEAGEGDEIIGGNEAVFGGAAGDIIRAPFGSTAAHELFGTGGDDTIDGADGNDRLTGGPGADTITAFRGDDRIFAKDGEKDTLTCGFDTDTAEADGFDSVGFCENVTIGVLRLAPKALRTKAGQAARLRLSWRHPKAWKQLKTIELRLLSREGLAVGEVTIRPRAQRISAHGAVRLAAKHSRLARKGRTVSARLALRLDQSLAGRRLRLEVEATDQRGRRQLEPKAGRIRVAG